MKPDSGSLDNGNGNGYGHGLPVHRREGGADSLDARSAFLLRLFQEGHREAGEELLGMWWKVIYDFARGSLGNHEDAEDLAQEVFLTASARLAGFTPEAAHSFRAWLFRIERNKILDLKKRQGRLGFQSFEEAAQGPGDDAEQGESHAMETVPVDGGAEDAESIDEAVRREMTGVFGWIKDEELLILFKLLPAPQREALTLFCLQDLSTEQVAEAMSRSRDDVYKLLNRGAAQIKERLSKMGERRLRRGRRPAMRRRHRSLPVLGARRFMLQGSSRPPHALARATMTAYHPPAPSRW